MPAGVTAPARVAALLACLVAASMGTTPVADFDVWCHLRTGRAIVEEGAFPSPDRWSIAGEGRPYDAHEWLAQLALHGCHAAAGNTGLVGLKALGLGGLALVLCLLTRGTADGAIVAGLTAWLALPRVHERPHLATLLLVAVAMAAWDNDGPAPLLAALLGALWANLHAGAAVLLPMLLLRLAGEGLATGRLPAIRGRLVASAAAALAGAMLNPSGPALFLKPLQIGEEGSFRGIIQEWVPLYGPELSGHAARRAYVVLVLVGAVAAAWAGRRGPVRWLPWAAAALVLPLRASRYLEVAVPAVGAFAALCLASRPPRPSRWLAPAASGVLATLLAASLVPAAREVCGIPPFGTGVASDIPEAAARFLDAQGIHGRVYNELQFGCYLLWARPGDRVLVDGRVTVYGPEAIARFQRAGGDPAELEALVEEYGIDHAVLRHPPESAPAEAECHRVLMDRLGFVPAHLDDAAVVYLRRVERFREAISRAGLSSVDPLDPVGSALTRPAARDELERLEGQAPGSARVLTALGLARLRAGARDAAVAPLERAVAISPRSSVAWWALGVTCLERGDAEGALQAAERAAELAPASPAAARLRESAIRVRSR